MIYLETPHVVSYFINGLLGRLAVMRVLLQFFLGWSLVLTGCVSHEAKQARQAAQMNAQAAAADTSPSVYKVAAGDSLRIEFLFNEELNRVVAVRPDGYLSLPLIEDVQVVDQTLMEVRQRLADRYTGTLKNPRIAVSLENLNSYKIYVGGAVANPGVFALAEGVTALRAIAMAGGAKPTAGLDSVVVIRDQGTRVPQYLMIDLKASLSRFDGKEDIRLRPKDMVFIPQSRIATINQFVDQYMNQLIPFQKSLNVTYLFGRGAF